MRLSGSTCAIVLCLLVVSAGGALLLNEIDARQGDEADGDGDALNLESHLGIEATKRGHVGRPKSVHAAARHSTGREAGSRAARRTAREAGSRAPREFAPTAGTYPVVRIRQDNRVAVRAEPGGAVVDVFSDRTEFGSPTVFSVVKSSGRWVGVGVPSLPNGEVGWIWLDERTVELGWTERSVHVDLSARRVTLRERNRKLRTFTVTVGAPGTRTPTGRFAVTDTFRDNLNPVYGCCAVALTANQPNLPASWPGGDRIAIHGNGTGQPLGIAASNGCLRAENDDVSALVDAVDLGTPVFIVQ